tara:strand:- start:148 stop:390 length:243 start_codon:yes stop_codon:yes gene_type:complete
MEHFLSEEKEEEPEVVTEPETEISASEKLKQFKSEEGIKTESEEVIVEEEEEKPEKKDKKSKKRRGPPKGGSFGPTVGGF